jgi:hypothetical protein
MIAVGMGVVMAMVTDMEMAIGNITKINPASVSSREV